ncbi:MAG: HAMP domain-containing sensor histidine kinase, partial [Candidatus Sumerlaeota bacterium]|nr:HAMP domain-containing sensor histidine kinase [Candidatus Sumerlaeota bacterium]
ILIRTRVTENGWICVSVHDNGCGIPTEKMQQIFLPFFTTKGSKGTGLGLPMTKKIIESMGGKLLCKSKEGAGTTFEIALPPEAPKGAAPAGADDAGEEDDNERTPQPAG